MIPNRGIGPREALFVKLRDLLLNNKNAENRKTLKTFFYNYAINCNFTLVKTDAVNILIQKKFKVQDIRIWNPIENKMSAGT